VRQVADKTIAAIKSDVFLMTKVTSGPVPS
jgi:hypothetical protein